MKIAALSDLHGYLDLKIDPSDICIIAGDILPLNIQIDVNKSRKWLNTKFREWANSLECDKVIFVAGNHDFFCEREEIHDMFLKTDKVAYLDEEEYVFEKDGQSIKIYGSPLSHRFGRWAFMQDEDELAISYKKIPFDVDILLTHDAPFGVSDVCFQSFDWMNNGEHIGSTALRDAIIEKKPKYCIHGHLHSSNHDCELLKDTKVYNVSIKDEHYYPIYQPLYLEI